jgi:hypothetical protein
MEIIPWIHGSPNDRSIQLLEEVYLSPPAAQGVLHYKVTGSTDWIGFIRLSFVSSS